MDKIVRITPLNATLAAAAAAPPDPGALFHPVEHAILRKYFKLRPRRSDPQDLFEPAVSEGGGAASAHIGIDRNLSGFGVENAVARLCLGAIQHRLPQWAAVYEDGRVALNRNRYARSARLIEPKPVFLFEINWADSGPGFSWPVAYHATWIPGYERWVVTGSADGPDVWGCSDIAIGSFRGTDIVAGAGRILRRSWRSDFREFDQSPWAYLFDSGLVSEKEALAWRARAWRGHENL